MIGSNRIDLPREERVERFQESYGADALLDAAEVAHSVDAVAATRLLQRALDLLSPTDERRREGMLRLAECAAWAGMAPLAEATAREVMAEYDDEPRASLALARSLHVQDRIGEAIAYLDKLLETDVDEPFRSRGVAQRALAHADLMNLSQATNDAQAVLSGPPVDSLAQVVASMAMGTVRHYEGRSDEAIEIARMSAAVADRAGDLDALRQNPWLTLGAFLAFANRHGEAESTFRQALEVSERLGCRWDAATTYWYWGFTCFRAGRWDDALDRLRRGADVAVTYAVCEIANMQGLSAVIFARRGEFAHAQNAVHRGRERSDNVIASAWFAWAESLMLEARSQYGTALDGYLGLWDEARSSGSEAAVSGIIPDLMRSSRIDTVVRDRVRHDVEEACRRTSNVSLEAHLRFARGISEASAHHLEAAHASYVSIGLPLYAGLAKEEQAVELAASGGKGASKRALTEALDLFERLGSWTDERRARSRLRAHKVSTRPTPVDRQAETGWGSLTPTERTVAGLVAQGMRNQQIAEQMFVSVQTVQTHLKRLFKKLGVTSRLQLGLQVSPYVNGGHASDD